MANRLLGFVFLNFGLKIKRIGNIIYSLSTLRLFKLFLNYLRIVDTWLNKLKT